MQTNSCTYDFFDKSYALFAYHAPLLTGQNFTIRNLAGSTSILFYTAWTASGGITGLGRPVDVETAITAAIVPPATTGTTATYQTYLNGAIYSITSGLNKNVALHRNAADLRFVREQQRSRGQPRPADHARDRAL